MNPPPTRFFFRFVACMLVFFSAITFAVQIGVVGNDSSAFYIERTAGITGQQNYIIHNMSTQLNDTQGFFVYTPHTNATACYSVLNNTNQSVPGLSVFHRSGQTFITWTETNWATNYTIYRASCPVSDAIEINDTDAAPEPVVVYESGPTLAGYPNSRVYTMFMDQDSWNSQVFRGQGVNYAVSLPPWYDGTPSDGYNMSLTLFFPSAGNRYFVENNTEPANGRTVFVNVDDPYFSGTSGSIPDYSAYPSIGQGWNFGQPCVGTNASTGGVCNFLEAMDLRIIQDVKRNYPFIQSNKVYAWGHSMGGSEALAMGIRYPEVFTAVYASEPMTNFSISNTGAGSTDWVTPQSDNWGAPADGLLFHPVGSTIQYLQEFNNTPVWKFIDLQNFICANQGRDTALISLAHGTADNIIDTDTQGYAFYNASNRCRLAYFAVITAADHTSQFSRGEGENFNIGLSELWFFTNTFSSVLAYTNATNSTVPGVVGTASYNQELQWSTDDHSNAAINFDGAIVDTASHYRITIRSTDGTVTDTRSSGPTAINQTVTITPRRFQAFTPGPAGTSIYYNYTTLSNSLLGNGTVLVDSYGLVTIPDVLVSTAGTRLNLVTTYSSDTTAPSLTVQNPVNNSNYSSNSVALNYITEGNADTCFYSIDQGTNTSIGSCANTTLTPGRGKHSIVLYVNDSSNNINSSGVLNVTVDVYSPLLTIQSPLNWSNVSGSLALNFIVLENLTAATCSYSLDNTANVSLANCANTTISPSAGTHRIFLYANDTVGNLNVSSNITFTVDPYNPELTVNAPINNSNYSSNSVDINFIARDNTSGLDTCFYSLDWGTNTTLASCNNATITPGRGRHSLLVFTNDTVGNLNSSGNITFTVDVYPPLLTVQSPTNRSNFSSSVSLNFIVSENLTSATCSYSLDNAANVSIASCANTSISPSPGVHRIFIYANDTVGNLNVSQNLTFTVDPYNPELTVNAPINNSNYSSNSVDINFIARDNSTALDTCFYSLDWGTNTTLASCNNATITPGRGRHSLLVFTNDTVGNLNSSGNITFTVDVYPPTLSVEIPVNVTNLSSELLDIHFTVSENLTSVTCAYSLDGGVNTTLTNCANHSITLTPGRHNIFFYANDTVGNFNSSGNLTVNFDTYAPTLSIQSPLNSTNLSVNSLDLNFIVSENLTAATCSYSLDNTANVSIANCANTSITPGRGRHNIFLYANDTVGNLNTSTNLSFTVDTYSPLLSIQSPANGSNFSSSVALNFIVSENLTSATCSYSLDNAANVSIASCANTTISPSAGTHHIFFYANDTVGNLNISSNITFIIDTTMPSVTLESPENGSDYNTTSIDFNFSVRDASGISACFYSLNGAANATVSNCANTTLSASSGSNTLILYANDTAGNVNSSGQIQFTVTASSDSSTNVPHSSSSDSSLRSSLQASLAATMCLGDVERITLSESSPSRAHVRIIYLGQSNERFDTVLIGDFDEGTFVFTPHEAGQYQARIDSTGVSSLTKTFTVNDCAPPAPAPVVETPVEQPVTPSPPHVQPEEPSTPSTSPSSLPSTETAPEVPHETTVPPELVFNDERSSNELAYVLNESYVGNETRIELLFTPDSMFNGNARLLLPEDLASHVTLQSSHGSANRQPHGFEWTGLEASPSKPLVITLTFDGHVDREDARSIFLSLQASPEKVVAPPSAAIPNQSPLPDMLIVGVIAVILFVASAIITSVFLARRFRNMRR